MNFILIPVKDLSRAKQRLAALMTQPERTELARLMMTNSFAQIAEARGADGVAVVTNYDPAIQLAHRHGFDVISETEQISESASVDFGSGHLASHGVRSVLRLPLDLPLLTAEDIELLLAEMSAAEHAATIIVPSREGTGTNAIARTPPDLFPSHFGPNSLSKHLAEAKQRNADCQVIELPRIALDIDDPADVAFLLEQTQKSCVTDFLHELQIQQRLSGLQAEHWQNPLA